MLERDLIHTYLKSLAKYLSRLSKPEADEVIREIESHIYDAVELAQEQNGSADIEEILARLGSPRELAAQYTDHILEGRPLPQGFRSMQRIKRGASKGLMVSMAIMGFGFSLVLALIGAAKFIFPDQVGAWSAAQGNSVIIGFTDSVSPSSTEVLGWWFIPVAWLIAAASFYITRKVLAVMKVSMISAQ
ncbi:MULTISPECIES: hypothetical protein [Gammaproteobacteria]|uniref:HAAS signaling domain-containing protein n=1 Tax=Gammaproteobacteria TaxID=1236 RepID=UPI000DD00836|nr:MULTISPECIES: hypothetical protein [Gammaproteobacteria]RTE85499.1 hypothetical protein DQX04_11390 [Aliidiomarina sp. B3213]TCZ89468.1 hypothetical protein EYQ95_11315 [Lysobacter sp. N42]